MRIGVFDSGVGGLSVLRHIRALLPAAELLYVADCAHLPYGDKPAAAVEARVCAIGDFLLSRGADALVVACNTATAAAVQQLRARCRLPVVGLEPGIKPAVAASRSGVVGVLATAGTLRSDKYARLLAAHRGAARIIGRACDGWAELVERLPPAQLGDDATARRAVRTQLAPLLDAGADTLVLGCTHYPFLADLIADVAADLSGTADGVALVDTGEPVARQLRRLLDQRDRGEGHGERGSERGGEWPGEAATAAAAIRLWASGDQRACAATIARLWPLIADPARAGAGPPPLARLPC